MSDDTGRKTDAGADGTPLWLEFLVPAVMLVVSVAYALELKDIAQPDLNLLLLQPLLFVFWALLFLVGWLFLLPLLKGKSSAKTAVPATPPSPSGRREDLLASASLKSGLLTCLIIIYVLVVFRTNYVISTFCFLALSGFLLGLRTFPGLAALAAIGTAVLYTTATYILDIRLY